jgi:hypothetical protein
MKTYWKILLTVLPLVLFFLFLSVGTTYYFSRKALTGPGGNLAGNSAGGSIAGRGGAGGASPTLRPGRGAGEHRKSKNGCRRRHCRRRGGRRGIRFCGQQPGDRDPAPGCKGRVGRDVSEAGVVCRDLTRWGGAGCQLGAGQRQIWPCAAYFEPWEWLISWPRVLNARDLWGCRQNGALYLLPGHSWDPSPCPLR